MRKSGKYQFKFRARFRPAKIRGLIRKEIQKYRPDAFANIFYSQALNWELLSRSHRLANRLESRKY